MPTPPKPAPTTPTDSSRLAPLLPMARESVFGARIVPMAIGIPKQVGEAAGMVRALVATRVIRPVRPDHLIRLGLALRHWGSSPAAGSAAMAALYADEPYVIDELGRLTFGEIDARTNALASSLAAEGAGEGRTVALMCRNHRGFVEAALACAKAGADC